MFTIVWIATVLNAAQNRHWTWHIMIVLFPCCATPVYALFAYFFSRALRDR